MRTRIIAGALGALLVLAAPALAQAPIGGEWSIARNTAPGAVQLTFRSDADDSHDQFDSAHVIDESQMGIAPSDLDSTGKHVTFSIVRDPGTFACEGWAAGGHASGRFTFAPNPAYLNGLRARGIGPISAHEQLTAATLDISLAYIDDIAHAGFTHLTFEKLIPLCALGVTGHSIAALRGALHQDLTEEDVIPLTALHVTPSYLADLTALGVGGLDAHGAIRMKALGIDRAYVDDLAKAGYPHLDRNDLVQMKALGVNGDYIRGLAEHGFHNLPVRDLVRMKAVGI